MKIFNPTVPYKPFNLESVKAGQALESGILNPSKPDKLWNLESVKAGQVFESLTFNL